MTSAHVPLPTNLLVEQATVHAGQTLPEGRWVLLITATGRVNKADGEIDTVELTVDLADGLDLTMKLVAAMDQIDNAKADAARSWVVPGSEETGGE